MAFFYGTAMDQKRLFNIEEAAQYIGHSPGTLRNQISQGKLPFPFVKIGRKVLVDRLDLDKWISKLPRFGLKK